VKFIAFAQKKMDIVEEGIVGVITNHSWLDNPVISRHAPSLMQTFEQVYVLDLYSSAKRKDRAPDGSRDEIVFDIEQGLRFQFLPIGRERSDLCATRKCGYPIE
jgi:predicted helicase